MEKRVVYGVMMTAIAVILLWTSVDQPYVMGAAGVMLGSGITVLAQIRHD